MTLLSASSTIDILTNIKTAYVKDGVVRKHNTKEAFGNVDHITIAALAKSKKIKAIKSGDDQIFVGADSKKLIKLLTKAAEVLPEGAVKFPAPGDVMLTAVGKTPKDRDAFMKKTIISPASEKIMSVKDGALVSKKGKTAWRIVPFFALGSSDALRWAVYNPDKGYAYHTFDHIAAISKLGAVEKTESIKVAKKAA